MSLTLKLIIFFIIAILANIGQMSDNNNVSKFCYTVTIVILANWVAFWS